LLRIFGYIEADGKVYVFMKIVAQVGLAASALAASGVAEARPATLALNLQAEVVPFCRIEQSNPDSPLMFFGGRAEIGAVRETCNTRSGYTVRAEVLNVTSGTVVAGDETAEIGPNGGASFSYGEARRQQRMWYLTNARKAVADGPSYVRLSISPF
jgi:hypothetical protein